MTALMEASLSGQKDVVQLLLDNKADVNAKDKNRGATALVFAADNGHEDVVQLLKKAGAKQ